tara:strand:- start:274 stop:966 length:693 start_codon:yes stop_codon:yes gene_type:complete
MVRSLNPIDGDNRTEPGRRLSNTQIGELMLLKLAESIERHRPKGKNRSMEAVEALLASARRRARATGLSVSEVLRQHQDAIEANSGDGRFLQTVGKYNKVESANQLHALMDEQDDRRKTVRVSKLTKAAAKAVEANEARFHLVPVPTATYGRKHGEQSAAERADYLRIPSHVSTSTSVMKAPARRDTMGGMVPNADRLRLTEKPVVNRKSVLRLMDKPGGGGGMHNPHRL